VSNEKGTERCKPPEPPPEVPCKHYVKTTTDGHSWACAACAAPMPEVPAPVDSAELAAIVSQLEEDEALEKERNGIPVGMTLHTEHRRALLRMVDGLRAELVRTREISHRSLAQAVELRRELSENVDAVISERDRCERAEEERDELRAKLAEADLDVQVHRVKFDTVNQCILWDTPYPREAELLTECRRQEERAEAAEARVKELTAENELLLRQLAQMRRGRDAALRMHEMIETRLLDLEAQVRAERGDVIIGGV
jgi:hypothetical protein